MAFVDQFRHQQGVVKRGFSSGHLNKAWVADLTYIIATEPKITYIVFIALSFHVLLLTGGGTKPMSTYLLLDAFEECPMSVKKTDRCHPS